MDLKGGLTIDAHSLLSGITQRQAELFRLRAIIDAAHEHLRAAREAVYAHSVTRSTQLVSVKEIGYLLTVIASVPRYFLLCGSKNCASLGPFTRPS